MLHPTKVYTAVFFMGAVLVLTISILFLHQFTNVTINILFYHDYQWHCWRVLVLQSLTYRDVSDHRPSFRILD